MSRFDITKTNAAVEQLIEQTDNPRHRYLLHAYNRHRYLEMAGRWEEIFAPDLTVEHPVYNFNAFGHRIRLEGADAVKKIYREWADSGQCVFYVEDEKIAVGDHLICTTFTLYQQIPGGVLTADGVDADPQATYLMKNAQHMIWPYDDQGRLIGEDVWEVDESARELILLDPSEVLTREESARLLAPLIKPLPTRPF
ncbi:hypothetical protein OH809_08220 [Streptomyces sp. NBC_00873]|uniref:hypothetical protein n=1 Tax=unclassified Streptomyces TaxID=2593676 RepID=UPI0038702A3A|nr:hypothetical protein OH809_08220 [Streptomyces sp. NBC_00873]WTA47300.1 hypothetical protein OH821_35585 [Streptomyces sp. NBC_00842]